MISWEENYYLKKESGSDKFRREIDSKKWGQFIF
jgi:hypothetical protein